MKILFIGQKGIPAKNVQHSPEHRAQVLAYALSAKDHDVYVLNEKSYQNKFLRNIEGVHLVYSGLKKDSIISQLILTISLLRLVLKLKPEVIHFQSWNTALLVRLIALLKPETTLIWTISDIPHNGLVAHSIAFQARAAFDAISTPYRDLQYKLLVNYGIRAHYIPDGYNKPILKDIAPKHWALRKGQYIFSTATTKEEAQSLIDAHKALKSRRKLVFCSDDKSLMRLSRRNKHILVLQPSQGRSLTSLIRQSSAVIALEKNISSSVLLQAMDAARPLIVSNYPLHEEIVGTGAYVVAPDSISTLTYALKLALSQKVNTAAAKRAQSHFTWPRVFEEYSILYNYPYVRRISVDSAVQKVQEFPL